MPLDPVVEQLLESMPPLVDEAETVQQVRQRFAEVAASPALTEAAPAPASVHDTDVPGAEDPIGARVYRPADSGSRATVVYFHGGGYAIGNLDTHDLICREICRRLDAVVLSVSYRLAPENPFPAGFDDCLAATRWAAAHIDELGGDPALLAVAGDSAGGNLAAAVAQERCTRGEQPGIAAQLLIYPATDVSRDYPSRTEYGEGYFLDHRALELFASAYVTDLSWLADPRMSPITHTDLADLPPTVVVTAEFDPIRDQGEAYADALERAGVRVRRRRFAGLIHGFVHFGPFVPAAQAAVDETCSLLREVLET